MRNLSLIDKCTVPLSFLETCCVAAIESNLLYFANENELCKLDVNSSNPEENVINLLIL